MIRNNKYAVINNKMIILMTSLQLEKHPLIQKRSENFVSVTKRVSVIDYRIDYSHCR